MGERVRWGILGAGSIARAFAKGLRGVDDASLTAVGSRSKEKADTFADEFGIARRHGSYEALASDPEVDAVYIATPHTYHRDHTLLVLDSGKAVLCEKPFAVNAGDVRLMTARAKERGCFLMEAMWTRFLPATVRVREWVADGRIGEVRNVTADFGFRSEVNPTGRLYDMALAGGALLDVGVYTIAYASMIIGGAPVDMATTVNIGTTGVDEENASVFRYRGGEIAVLQSAIRLNTPHTVHIFGTQGRIEVPNFWRTESATLLVNGKEPEVFNQPHRVNGYEYEAMEVGRCLKEGILESPTMTHKESLLIMETMDRLRQQWGLVYPADRK